MGEERIIRTQLEKYLKNPNITEFNFGDHDLYIVKELTKNLAVIYNTSNLVFGDMKNVGVYDRRKNGFVLTNPGVSYTINQTVKPYKNDEQPIVDYQLYSQLKKHIRTELNSFYSTNKFQRTYLNDLNDEVYQELVYEKAVEHCEKRTVPQFKEFGQEEIDKIQINDDLTIKILEDIYDVAYEMAEEILENNEKGVYEYFLVQDILEKMEELKSDKSNPLAISMRLNELIHHEKYASYNVEVYYYKGKKNASIKVKKDKLNEIPVFAIKKISWRSTELFNSNDYKAYNYENMTKDDWVNVLFTNNQSRHNNYYSNNDFYLFNFVPEFLLSDPDFWLSDKNNGQDYNHISKTLLKDRDFICKFTSKKKNLLNMLQSLEAPINEDSEICINLLKNSGTLYIGSFNESTLKNKDFQLGFIELVEDVSHFAYMDQYFMYTDADINNAIADKILNISTQPTNRNRNYRVYGYHNSTVSKNLVKHIERVDVVNKLIELNAIQTSQMTELKSDIINDKNFLDYIILNQSTSLIYSYNYNFETIYKKLNQDIINDDYYLGNLLRIFFAPGKDEKEAKKIIDKTIGLAEFEKRTNIHDLLLEDNVRFDYTVVIPTKSINQNFKNCIAAKKAIDRNIFRSYLRKVDMDIDLAVDISVSDPDRYIYDYNFDNVSFFKALFARDSSIIHKLPQHLFRNNSKLLELAADYTSVLDIASTEKNRWSGKKFLIDTEDFVIKNLKHNFADIIYVKKPCKHDNDYSILNEPKFITKLIQEFPDKMNILIPYLVNNKFVILDNEKIVKQFLLHDFALIYHFKRKVYNNEELILDIIKKSTQDKDYIIDKLTGVGSKLIKDKNFLKKID